MGTTRLPDYLEDLLETSSDPDRDRELYEATMEDDAYNGCNDLYALFVLDAGIPSAVCHCRSPCTA